MEIEETAWSHHELGYCYMEIGMNSNALNSGQKTLELAMLRKPKLTKLMLNANILIGQALCKYVLFYKKYYIYIYFKFLTLTFFSNIPKSRRRDLLSTRHLIAS